MSDWTSEYIQQIEDCEARESQCSEWEITFLDSLRTQIEAGKRPTPPQVETLDEIWNKATRKG